MLYDKMMYDLYKKKDIKINQDLYINNRQDDLAKYIIDVLKVYERVPNIKLVDWEHITDETLIEPYLINQRHVKTKINYKKHQPIDDSRYELLKVYFEVDLDTKKNKYQLDLLLPKRYKKFYFLLGGNKFYPIYQLIDSSTYSRKNSVILKPMNIIRTKANVYDINGEEFELIKYSLLVFRKRINPLLLYASVLGIDNMLQYMFLDNIINVLVDDKDNSYTDDTKIYFKLKGSVVSVIKYFLENDNFIQSVVSNLIEMLSESKLASEDEINDRDFWAEQLGRYYTSAKEDTKRIIKAKEIINSFTAISTNLYKENLKLDEINKSDTFAILRWIMQNFTQLKVKDSLDLKNKRIRLNEYIADYFSQYVNSKLHRFLSNGSTQTYSKDLENLFKYPNNIIIKKLMYTKSPLLRYDNSVNDMDFFTAFKYSIKGPSSLNTGSRTSVSLMSVHHSHLGRIDLNSSSASDPGVTGYFTPFAKVVDGKFFDTTEEPQDWIVNFCKMYSNYFKGTKYKIEHLDYFEDMDKDNRKFLKRIHNIQHFVESYTGSNKKIKIIDAKRSRKKKIVVYTESEEDIKPQPKALFKKKTKKLFKNK